MLRQKSVILFCVTLEQFRQSKNEFFKSAQSPLPSKARADFTGLRYFAEKTDLRFSLPLERDPSTATILMQTSTGAERVYQRLGWVTFTVDGSSARLALYAPEGIEQPLEAFVPFMDATGGVETYEGGRYVEAALTGETVALDFNLAYNPYCAYADHWSCPIPPLENRLKIAIRAGEKTFGDQA